LPLPLGKKHGKAAEETEYVDYHIETSQSGEESEEEETAEEDERGNEDNVSEPEIQQKVKKKVSRSDALLAAQLVQKMKPNPSKIVRNARVEVELTNQGPVLRSVSNGTEADAGKMDVDIASDGKKKTKERKVVLFNDKNIDINLHSSSTQAIKTVRVKLTAGLVLYNQIIHGLDLQYVSEYAAITFMKKMKNDQAFEFSFPMIIAPLVQKALQCVIDNNKSFYANMKPFDQIG